MCGGQLEIPNGVLVQLLLVFPPDSRLQVNHSWNLGLWCSCETHTAVPGWLTWPHGSRVRSFGKVRENPYEDPDGARPVHVFM